MNKSEKTREWGEGVVERIMEHEEGRGGRKEEQLRDVADNSD